MNNVSEYEKEILSGKWKWSETETEKILIDSAGNIRSVHHLVVAIRHAGIEIPERNI